MKLIPLLLAAMLALPASAQTLRSNIAYGNAPRNVMDLYLPQAKETPPVVLFIHGGRWFRGDKEQVLLYNRVKLMNDAGIAVASMNCTFSKTALWPAQKSDVEATLLHLTTNAASLGIDASRIAVWGQSSGAHLALWSALIAAENPTLSVDAIVSWYAPSNLSMIAPDRLADDVPGGNERFKEPSPESLLVGATVPFHRAKADAASPQAQFANLSSAVDLPPMLLIHGDADFVVSPLQTIRLFETVKKMGGNAELEIVPGAKHGGDAFGAVAKTSVAYLEAVFGL